MLPPPTQQAPGTTLPRDLAKEALARATRSTMPPATLGLGFLYLLFFVGHLLLLPPLESRILAPFALGSAVLLLGAWFYLRRTRLPLRLVNPGAFAILQIVNANVFLHVSVTGDSAQALNAVLIVVGASGFLLSRAWLGAMLLTSLPLFWLIGLMLPKDETAHWWFAFVSAAALGGILQTAIRGLVIRYAKLAHRDRLRQGELSHALGEAESLKERLEVAMQGANDGIWDWDLETNRLTVSSRWNLIAGLDGDEDRHIQEWGDKLHPSDRERVDHAIRAHVGGQTSHLEISYRLQIAPGQYRVVLTRGLVHRDIHGKAYRIAGSLTDFTNTETHDPNTGLPGRAVLLERIGQALERWRRSDHSFAVFHVDLGGLSEIGESLSSQARDQFLVASSERLESHLRANDLIARPGALSRTGGDQFTMLLEGIEGQGEALDVAERLQSLFEEPFKVEGTWVKADLRLGVALPDERTAEDHLRHAGMAARHARKTGEPLVIFDHALESGAQESVLIESELRQAIAAGELCAHYQPVLNLESSTIEGVEALVRWNHPTRGMIAPGDFIPIAERSDLIVDVDLFVLNQACGQVAEWLLKDEGIQLHVNVSARTYLSSRFLNDVQEALRGTRMKPSQLIIEITESLLMESGSQADRVLAELRNLGVRVALDDFGTGYSSLSRLDQLEFDILKIDRSFLQASPNAPSWRLVRTIVSLGEHFGLVVIAEGVERPDQVIALQEAGCKLAQGFLFAKPLAHDDMDLLLQDGDIGHVIEPKEGGAGDVAH